MKWYVNMTITNYYIMLTTPSYHGKDQVMAMGHVVGKIQVMDMGHVL